MTVNTRRLSLLSMTAMATALGLFAATSSFSQATKPTQEQSTVLSRLHPELAPLGVNMGAFILYPSLTTTLGSDNNIKSFSANKVSDSFLTLSPKLSLKSQFKRHYLNMTLSVDLPNYNDFHSENKNAYFFDSNLGLDFTNGWSMDALLQSQDHVEKRGMAVPTNALNPVTYNRRLAVVNLIKKFDSIKITAGVAQQNFDYDNNSLVTGNVTTPLNLSYNNRLETILRLRADYAFSPNASVFVAIRENDRKYDSNIVTRRDSKITTTQIGTNFNFSHLVEAEISAGTFNQEFKNPIYGDISGTSLLANVEWNPTRLTTLRFNLSRQDGDPGIATARGVLYSNVGMQIDHELLRNLILSANFQTLDSDFKGIDRKDTYKTYTFGGRYIMNRRVAIKLDFSHFDLSSSGFASVAEYKDDIVQLGLILSY